MLDRTTPEGRSGSGWDRFVRQLFCDFKLFLLVLLFLSVFRGLLLILFRSHFEGTPGVQDFIKCMWRGVRFDAVVATYAVLPSLLMSVLCGFMDIERFAIRARQVIGAIFAALSVVVCGIDIGFIQEYKEQFNHWIFGVLYDDRGAILRTVWLQYHVFYIGLGLLLAGAAAVWAALRVLRPIPRGLWVPHVPVWGRALFCLALMTLVFGGLRGSLGHRPLQMRDLAVTSDNFLNNLVANPYSALKYAWSNHQRLAGVEGIETFWPGGDIRKAAATAFPAGTNSNSIDDYLLRLAPGSKAEKPKHIFLVVMESYDAWPMLPRYQPLGLTPELLALAKKGLFVPAFISAGNQTLPSLASLITGLPEPGVNVNYQPSARRAFSTSAAPIFNQLGYRTRFFYGGLLSWQRIGAFCKDQGFDEIYGGGHVASSSTMRPWGVDDEDFLRLVLEKTDPDIPSFNLIMTTSYHPPYPLNVFEMGFRTREMPPELRSEADGSADLRVLGHLWYADKCIGEFVRSAEKQLKGAVFALTGDHWSRQFINQRPDLYVRTAVPFVLYPLPALEEEGRVRRMAGSHLDIIPTLIHLAAPRNFAYHAFGTSFLESQGGEAGFSKIAVINPDAIFAFGNPGGARPLQDATLPALQTLSQLNEKNMALHALAWWRIMKGNSLSGR